MFNFIKKTFQKIYTTCTSKFDTLFSQKNIDQATILELEKILIEADTGVATTKKIVTALKSRYAAGTIPDIAALKEALAQELEGILARSKEPSNSQIILLVGINGSGKTTLASKIAYKALQEGNKVLLVAADTFRAAAQEQLYSWAHKVGVDIVQGKPGQDPASVVFAGCTKFKEENYTTLIIDTAGRLQTKINLMKELEKIKRVIMQQLPNMTINTLLTVDAMLGQNSLEQARIFHESTQLDSIALTKMDGTGKGGIIFAISDQLGIPVAYLAFGEKEDQLKVFDAKEYVSSLLNKE